MGRDWSAWIDTIETIQYVYHSEELKGVGIDLPELIRLKLELKKINKNRNYWSGLICLNWYDWNAANVLNGFAVTVWSGLICLNWYDWNYMQFLLPTAVYQMSGLICLNWYDWNIRLHNDHHSRLHSRDWSAWIDTIETLSIATDNSNHDKSGLICLNWYDWNSASVGNPHKNVIFTSGLICLNWYDWNLFLCSFTIMQSSRVGIDLPELIRLKPLYRYSPVGNKYTVGIDLPELIRLKQ